MYPCNGNVFLDFAKYTDMMTSTLIKSSPKNKEKTEFRWTLRERRSCPLLPPDCRRPQGYLPFDPADTRWRYSKKWTTPKRQWNTDGYCFILRLYFALHTAAILERDSGGQKDNTNVVTVFVWLMPRQEKRRCS